MPTIEVMFCLHPLLLETQSLQTHKGLLRPQVLPIKAGEAHLATEGCQHWRHNAELVLHLCALSFMRNSFANVEKLQEMLQTHRLRTEGREPCNTAEGKMKETKKPNSDVPHILTPCLIFPRPLTCRPLPLSSPPCSFAYSKLACKQKEIT